MRQGDVDVVGGVWGQVIGAEQSFSKCVCCDRSGDVKTSALIPVRQPIACGLRFCELVKQGSDNGSCHVRLLVHTPSFLAQRSHTSMRSTHLDCNARNASGWHAHHLLQKDCHPHQELYDFPKNQNASERQHRF